MKERYIACNIKKIEDSIQYCNYNNLPGIILNIDFQKDFDTINRQSIFNNLELLYFGPKFINNIKTLYTKIETTCLNKGNILNWFCRF